MVTALLELLFAKQSKSAMTYQVATKYRTICPTDNEDGTFSRQEFARGCPSRRLAKIDMAQTRPRTNGFAARFERASHGAAVQLLTS
jgi:hypothetical protein